MRAPLHGLALSTSPTRQWVPTASIPDLAAQIADRPPTVSCLDAAREENLGGIGDRVPSLLIRNGTGIVSPMNAFLPRSRQHPRHRLPRSRRLLRLTDQRGTFGRSG